MMPFNELTYEEITLSPCMSTDFLPGNSMDKAIPTFLIGFSELNLLQLAFLKKSVVFVSFFS